MTSIGLISIKTDISMIQKCNSSRKHPVLISFEQAIYHLYIQNEYILMLLEGKLSKKSRGYPCSAIFPKV